MTLSTRLGLSVAALACLLLLSGCSCDPSLELSTQFCFAGQYIDQDYGGNGRPGWVRAGDMDGDGDTDIVVGGGRALYVYENTDAAERWTRHGSLDESGEIGANGAVLFDVDDDGDLDVVSAQYRASLGWWQNPGGSLSSEPWPYYTLDVGSAFFAHDVHLADLDGDGKRREFIYGLHQSPEVRVEWFQPGSDPREPWTRSVVEAGRSDGDKHYAGTNSGDVDADGDIDIVFSNGWYEATGEAGQPWQWHEITRIPGISNSLLWDLNSDGRLDLILSAGHHGQGVYWFEAPPDRRDSWHKHTIDSSIVHPECLQATDLDADGDMDLVTCDLDFERWDEEVHSIYVLENQGEGSRWLRHAVAPAGFPSHLLQLVDINADDQLDIISEATGFSVVSFYSRLSPKNITSAEP